MKIAYLIFLFLSWLIERQLLALIKKRKAEVLQFTPTTKRLEQLQLELDKSTFRGLISKSGISDNLLAKRIKIYNYYWVTFWVITSIYILVIVYKILLR